jgi:transcriptional regulator with XRE-family HTH domain
MIANHKQYLITKKQIGEFEAAIEAAEVSGPDPGVHERIHEAMIHGLKSQLTDLNEQVDRYEALKGGKVRTRRLHSLLELPIALIEGRIVAGLTQSAVAKKLGIPEQQIQRYEATRYAGASLDRVQEVAEAVGLKIKDTVTYAIGTRGEAKSTPGGRGSGVAAKPKAAPRRAASTPAAGRVAASSDASKRPASGGHVVSSSTTHAPAPKAAQATAPGRPKSKTKTRTKSKSKSAKTTGRAAGAGEREPTA